MYKKKVPNCDEIIKNHTMMKELTTEELKATQLEILKHVDKFCKEHNIKYSIYAGTLIGTVRHHGFIPWDDDIDIMMLRDQYTKFLSEYSKSVQDRYKLYAFELDKNWTHAFAKVDDQKTVLIHNVSSQFLTGVTIDIFPVDKIPSNEKARKKIYFRHDLYRKLRAAKVIRLDKHRNLLKNLMILVNKILLFPITIKMLVGWITSKASLYENNCCEYCGNVVWGYGQKEMHPISDFDDYVNMVFEGYDVPVLKGYHNYLTATFGDYMMLPPKELQIRHHDFKAYWK